MSDILAPVPEKDRCPKNPPDGGHSMRIGPMSDGVPACRYCGAKGQDAPDERKSVEELAIELMTSGKSMTHGEQDARRLLDSLRSKWLNEGAAAIDHLRATMLAPKVDEYASGLSGAAEEMRRLAGEQGGAR
ncbi:hypothetical protein ABZ819_04845 [Streptomyces venezuelae]|uniref:hypothetical protein n=1 Tax=Streptomyces venezuelae TaxID=54571 RepID=UPI0034152D86